MNYIYFSYQHPAVFAILYSNLNKFIAFCAAITTIKPGVIAVDIGHNLTLPCPGEKGVVSWIRDGREPPDHSNVLDSGSLGIWDVQPSDAGVYTCARDTDEIKKESVRVIVRSKYIFANI